MPRRLSHNLGWWRIYAYMSKGRSSCFCRKRQPGVVEKYGEGRAELHAGPAMTNTDAALRQKEHSGYQLGYLAETALCKRSCTLYGQLLTFSLLHLESECRCAQIL